MMKCKINLLLIALSLCLLTHPGFPQNGQKEIVETISVNWWQVPVFAVDNSGNPILDLDAGDFEVWVNGKRIEGFTFYKRAFNAAEAKKESGSHGQPVISKSPGQPKLKNNTIFLLFDLVLSAESCGRKSKTVAREVIAKSSPDTHFVILTLEPFKGLNHVFGPSNDKKTLLAKLQKKVRPHWNSRHVDISKFFGPSVENLVNAEEELTQERERSMFEQDERDKELRLVRTQAAAYYMRKSDAFFSSFQSLYILFNSINDNKFVYFFTEGVSNALRDAIVGGKPMYNKFIRKTARQLGRSGAVLFIVNPMGVADDTRMSSVRKAPMVDRNIEPISQFNTVNEISGENSLHYLAEESGGKYVEGREQSVVQALENIHRAYYEISFPDIEGLKGNKRDIVIKPKRSSVSIHTLRSLEKTKSYAKMRRLEKQLFIINLASLNPMLKRQMHFQHARVTKMKTGPDKVIYTVKIPKHFVGKQLDFYKLWVRGDNASAQTVNQLEKAALLPQKRKIILRFPLEGKNKGSMPYFVLVDPVGERALVRVIGDRWTDSDEDEQKTRLAMKIQKKQPAIDNETFTSIMSGVAAYCEKLKSSAFHFMCNEEIVETRKPLVNSSVAREGWVSKSFMTPVMYPSQRPVWGLGPSIESQKAIVNKYRFSYRLLRNERDIKEERQWLTEKKDRPINVKKEDVVQQTAFFSERAAFAPTTMLAIENQDNYHFTFHGYSDQNGRRCAIIEGVPKKAAAITGFYGKVWVDMEDHSVLKVQADPRSINGYRVLKEFADKLKTRLQLSLEMDFGKLRGGIRFPTRVQMLEKYKGGRTISKFKGPSGWERNRTEFNYNEYRFFDVKSEVIVNH